MHSMQKSENEGGWLILKVDIEKAFNSISWNFIETIVTLYNFPPSFIKITVSCLKNIIYIPIIKEKKKQSFIPSRGIRQGDPISPSIFILAMKFLNKLIENKIEEKALTPFKFCNRSFPISHLLFFDDVLIFSKTTPRNLQTINDVLSTFCVVSGMQINTSKSKVWFSKTVPSSLFTCFQNSLNIRCTNDLGCYLGYPFKAKYKIGDFNFLLEKNS